MSDHRVTVTGVGQADDDVTLDENAQAHCAVCDNDVELVVSIDDTDVCRACLRSALDAASIGSYRLRAAAGDAESGVPWGKVTS